MAFAPFNYWYLLFLSFPASLYLIAYQSPSVFKAGWWFGLGYFGAGISWVHVSISEYGGVPLVGSVGLMLLLCGYLALFPALMFSLLRRFFKPNLWPLALPFAWLLMEWIRTRFLTGFPWLSIAYSQTNSPLNSWFGWVGEVGLSALIVLVCISLVVGAKQKRWWLAFTPVLTLVISSIILKSVILTTPTGETRSVALVQGNIPQSIRWEPEKDQLAMDKYTALTQDIWGKDIIIWPEAAVPKLESLVRPFLSDLDDKATQSGSGFITGVINYNLETNIAYNSLVALGIDTQGNNEPYHFNHAKRFSKHHLLPIGEFVPFESLLRNIAPIFDLPMSSFSPGDYIQPNLIAGNTQLAPVICFEIAFPRQISANLTEQTQAIITVSNDAWFGNSHGPHQHLQIAQARSLEFGMPVLRATNNGVTAVIDYKGTIQSQLAQFTEAVLIDEIQLIEGKTPYREYGDFPIWLLMTINLFFAIWIKRVPKKNKVDD